MKAFSAKVVNSRVSLGMSECMKEFVFLDGVSDVFIHGVNRKISIFCWSPNEGGLIGIKVDINVGNCLVEKARE